MNHVKMVFHLVTPPYPRARTLLYKKNVNTHVERITGTVTTPRDHDLNKLESALLSRSFHVNVSFSGLEVIEKVFE
jgi:hypothetical protein